MKRSTRSSNNNNNNNTDNKENNTDTDTDRHKDGRDKDRNSRNKPLDHSLDSGDTTASWSQWCSTSLTRTLRYLSVALTTRGNGYELFADPESRANIRLPYYTLPPVLDTLYKSPSFDNVSLTLTTLAVSSDGIAHVKRRLMLLMLLILMLLILMLLILML